MDLCRKRRVSHPHLQQGRVYPGDADPVRPGRGRHEIPLALQQSHKRLYPGGQGPNLGPCHGRCPKQGGLCHRGRAQGGCGQLFSGGRSLCLRAGGQQPAVPPRNTEWPAAEKGGGGLRHGQAGRDTRFKGIDDFLYARYLYSTGQAEQIPSITS